MLSRLVVLLFTIFFSYITTFSQDAQAYYQQGVEKAESGDYVTAIDLFTKTIELQPENYYAWFNRGIAKSRMRLYEEALPDFEHTLMLDSTYKKAWLNIGIAHRNLTDYESAIACYSKALALDAGFADAYYNRGLAYAMLERKSESCADFEKALAYNLKKAEGKVELCHDTSESIITIHPIQRLEEKSTDKGYGFSSKKPILVGTGPEGGPGNQRAYLNLLRDAQGKPIQYERLGSCCSYKSDNAPLGSGMLDQYGIIYRNEKGEEEKATVYISFYDYEKPQILFGFDTVRKK